MNAISPLVKVIKSALGLGGDDEEDKPPKLLGKIVDGKPPKGQIHLLQFSNSDNPRLFSRQRRPNFSPLSLSLGPHNNHELQRALYTSSPRSPTTDSSRS